MVNLVYQIRPLHVVVGLVGFAHLGGHLVEVLGVGYYGDAAAFKFAVDVLPQIMEEH